MFKDQISRYEIIEAYVPLLDKIDFKKKLKSLSDICRASEICEWTLVMFEIDSKVMGNEARSNFDLFGHLIPPLTTLSPLTCQ